GFSNGPLHAQANSWWLGGNGVYGAMNAFPTTNGNGMNFWVDVLFSPSTTPAVQPSTSVDTSSVVAFASDSEWSSRSASTPTASVASPTSNPSESTWTSNPSVPQTTGYSWSSRNRNLFRIG
ncbi:MAG TPA: hypothetical protein VFT74_01805, partial [Isosphaeraceae bacterium]|nr:hypothetical protein [Isosphaeraceae bacterium]